MQKTLPVEWHQPVGVVNYPQTRIYTRVTEYKHLTGQKHRFTALTYEYPSATGEPFYPIRGGKRRTLQALRDAGARMRDVWFVGRLATYRYYNMDQVVGQALATFRRIQESVPLAAGAARACPARARPPMGMPP